MSNISGVIKSIRNFMRNDRGLNGDAQRLEQLGWMLFLKIFDSREEIMELEEENYQSPIPEHLKWKNWAADAEGITGDALLDFVNNTLFPELQTLEIPVDGSRMAFLIRETFLGNNNYMKSGTIMRKVLTKVHEIGFNSTKDKHLFGNIYEGLLKELQSAGKSGEFYTPRGVTQFMCDIIAPKLGETMLDPACGTGGFLTAVIEAMKTQRKKVEDIEQVAENVRGFEVKPLPLTLCAVNLLLHGIDEPNILEHDTLATQLTDIKKAQQVDIILANPPFGGVLPNAPKVNAKYQTRETADLFLLYIIRYLKTGGRAAIVLPDGSLTGEGVKARIREKWLTDCNLHTIVRLPNSVFKPYATVATNLLFFTKGKPTKEIWYYEHQLPKGQKSYSKTRPIRVQEFDGLKKWWNKRVENEQAWKVPIEVIQKRGWDLDIKNPNEAKEEELPSSAEVLKRLKKSFAESQGLLAEIEGALK